MFVKAAGIVISLVIGGHDRAVKSLADCGKLGFNTADDCTVA